MQVHLIDGTYELFRAFYGAPSATSPSGREVGAARGLLRSLEAMLREDAVTHIACAFDHVIESFRNRLFSGYKTGAGIEPSLLAQFPLAERVSQALGMVTWPMIEFEADDAISTFAHRCMQDPRVERVLLCTPDKDLAQCVRGEQVVMLDRMRRRIIDEAGVIEKFGIVPESIPDYLALVGDAADGIPGIPRWGAKSSSLVLARYRHLESIPSRETEWDVTVRGAKALSEQLEQYREESLLYRTLATLRIDADIDETVDELEWRGRNEALLHELRIELGLLD